MSINLRSGCYSVPADLLDLFRVQQKKNIYFKTQIPDSKNYHSNLKEVMKVLWKIFDVCRTQKVVSS